MLIHKPKVLMYFNAPPTLSFKQKTGGVKRMYGLCVKAAIAAGFEVEWVTSRQYFDMVKNHANLNDLENNKIIHCDDKEIMKDMCYNGRNPTVYGPHPRGIGFREPDYYNRDMPMSRVGILYKTIPNDKTVKFVGFDQRSFYTDLIIWRMNPGPDVDVYNPNIKYFRPGIETDAISPRPKKRKYLLWAGASHLETNEMKGLPIYQQLQSKVKLPKHLEWKTLSDYTIEEFLNVLDETYLYINVSAGETLSIQLFETWAKAVPTLYNPQTWGWCNRFDGSKLPSMKFTGLGGFTYKERTVDSISQTLHNILELDTKEVIKAGLLSRQLVEDQYNMNLFAENLTKLYTNQL